jgi:CRP-like cAMP-binding protein
VLSPATKSHAQKARSDVTALQKCEIELLPVERFVELLKQHPQIYVAVAKVLSADLRIAERVMQRRKEPQQS